MSSVQHLRIIFADEFTSFSAVHLDCSHTPRLKTLSIEKIKRYPLPAKALIFSAEKTSLQVLRLRHCWCTRKLLASLPPSVQSLELDECEDVTEIAQAEPLQLSSLKMLRIIQDDYEKERFLRYIRAPNARTD